MMIDRTNNERHNAFDNKGITFCTKIKLAVMFFTNNPHAALTAVNQILCGLI